MKIIGLLPFRNEAWILPASLSSLRPVVDEIIAFDDGSTDNSADVVESYGARVIRADDRPEAGWAEYDIREALLRAGRARSGTHFVCLDADEAISRGDNLRPLIQSLSQGQKLAAQWMALWKSVTSYRDDRSVWSNLFIDFAFCDDRDSVHNFAWLGVGRTPATKSEADRIKVADSVSCVLHFQFAAWNRFQMKQAWYRCSELIKAPGTARQINQKYAITLEDPKARLRAVPASWLEGLEIPPDLENAPVGWHLQAIERFFDQYGMPYFEPLQVWHIRELREEFISRVGRRPKPAPTHFRTPAYWYSRLHKAVDVRLVQPIRQHRSKSMGKQ